jgi:hypothetical protein
MLSLEASVGVWAFSGPSRNLLFCISPSIITFYFPVKSQKCNSFASQTSQSSFSSLLTMVMKYCRVFIVFTLFYQATEPSDYFVLSNFAGSEVLIAVTMKSTVLWCIVLCSPVEFHHCFEGTYCLHLQALLAACIILVSCLAYFLTLKMEQYGPLKHCRTFTGQKCLCKPAPQ